MEEKDRYQKLLKNMQWINIKLIFFGSVLFSSTNLILYIIKFGYKYIILENFMVVLFSIVSGFFVFICSLIPSLVLDYGCLCVLKRDILTNNINRRKAYLTYSVIGFWVWLITLLYIYNAIDGRIDGWDLSILIFRSLGITFLITFSAGESLFRLANRDIF